MPPRTVLAASGRQPSAGEPAPLSERRRWALRAVRQACAEAGLPSGAPGTMHFGHVVGCELPDVQMFARVSALRNARQARNSVWFGRHCAERGLPMIAPVAGADPVTVDSAVVTFWPLLHTVTSEIDWFWLGSTLRALHDSGDQASPRAVRTSRGQLQNRRDRYATARPRREVIRMVDSVIAELHRCAAVLAGAPTALIHGDPYKVNILTTGAGPRLVDYDAAGTGQIYLDLAPPFVYARRFGLGRAELDRFVAGYGRDHSSDTRFRTVVRLRELGMVTYLLDNACHDDAINAELVSRLRTADQPGDWTDLVELSANGAVTEPAAGGAA